MFKCLWRKRTVRQIDKIIIHCSATTQNMDVSVKQIDLWHKRRGWTQIGYHFVIKRDGDIEDGRPLDQTGAHVKGYNIGSIGVCMVGGVDKDLKAEDNFTEKQWRSLRNLLKILRADYKSATIHGHNEFSPKDCPSFSVQYELEYGRLRDVR